MSCDNSPKTLFNLWQTQPQERFAMSPEELRERMKKLRRGLLIRDATVWVIGVSEIAFFAFIFFVAPQRVAKVGSALIMIGMAYLTAQVWLDQRGRRTARERAQASGDINSIDFYRAELLRQREFHRGVWFWSRMAALNPGLLVFGIGSIVVFPWPDNLVGYCVTGVTLLLCPTAVWLNLGKSKSYQKQIDALDGLRQPQEEFSRDRS